MSDGFVDYDAIKDALGAVPGGGLALRVLPIGWLVVLFFCLFTVSDGHLVTALAHLASMMRLSPDIAGLTLLALGNGAPDFFTGISAGTSSLTMVVGAAVGAGLFLMTAVFGCVIWFAQPPKAHTDGIIVPPKDVESWRDPGNADKNCCPQLPRRHVLRATTVYLTALLLLTGIIVAQKAPLWFCSAMPVLYVCYMGATLIEYVAKRQSAARKASIVNVFDVDEFQDLSPIAKVRVVVDWPQGKQSVLWLRRVWCVCGTLLRLPFVLSIMPLEYSGEDMDVGAQLFVNRIRCAVAPIFAFPFVLFLTMNDKMTSKVHWVVAVAFSLVLSALLLFTTRRNSRPILFPLHVVIAFVTCILWIYALCTELVAALSFAAKQWGVQESVVGALALAIGNSFGDLVSNTAVSREGNFEAAVSSVFSSPIQNLLLTLGSVLVINAYKSPNHVALVEPSATVVLPLVLLFAVIACVVPTIVFYFKGRIPRKFGLLLLGTYGLYLPVAIYLAAQQPQS